MGFAKSGNLYASLTGSNAIVQVGPDGKEIARFPDPLTNMTFSPPLDGPIDVAFRGDSLLVANSGFVSNNSSSFAILDVFVGEQGFDPIRPKLPAPPTAPAQLKLTVRPRTVVAGQRTRLSFTVTGATGKAVRGARIRVGKTHVRSDKRGRATMKVVIHHAGTKRATVRSAGSRPGHAVFSARR
jgi:hypothetical protein